MFSQLWYLVEIILMSLNLPIVYSSIDGHTETTTKSEKGKKTTKNNLGNILYIISCTMYYALQKLKSKAKNSLKYRKHKVTQIPTESWILHSGTRPPSLPGIIQQNSSTKSKAHQLFSTFLSLNQTSPLLCNSNFFSKICPESL